VRTQNFSEGGGGADPDAIHNLCLILKVMLEKSCRKYNCNIALYVNVFLYIYTDIITCSMNQSHCPVFLFL
jgi:hypothetical protein